MKTTKTIAIIEDSRIVRDLLAFTLEKNINCNVHIINLNRIIKDLLKVRPDIIVLDYSLMDNQSQLNTMDLLKCVRSLLPDSPVIIFSGQTNLSIASELLKNGAVDYISKNTPTFHDEIILSVKKSINFVELLEEKKNQKKKNFIHLIKIISLLLFTGSLMGYLLVKQ